MVLKVEATDGKLRFAALLSGRGAALCDRSLLDSADWLLAPTLGAIVPGWLLAIPRQSATNFRDWARGADRSPYTLIEAVTQHLGLEADEVLWFEHGPAMTGTLVGCGLDYAHLHLIIRPSFDFAAFDAASREMADLDWRDAGASDAYAKLGEAGSYFIAGSGNAAIVAMDVEAGGSQFFRRVVASLTQDAERWNYRHYPHDENIERTVAMFHDLADVANGG